MWQRKILHNICFIFLFLWLGLFFQNKAYCEEVIELKISHFGSDKWRIHTDVLVPWAKEIEQFSKGRIKFTFYTDQILGKATEQYDLAVKGTADISVSLLSYSPGRFPLSSVMELPFLSQNAEQASLVFWSLYQKYLKDEFKDVKVLGLFCHGPGQLHSVNKEIKSLSDLKGLNIRGGSAPICKALELLGAVPVQASVNDTRSFVKEGKIDGGLLPWEGVMSFDFYDLTPYHTEVNMYTLTFFIVMNKEKYESLPDDVKRIIDENSGEVLAFLAGRVMDAKDTEGRKIAIEKGQSIYILPPFEFERWKKIVMPVGDAWIKEMEEKGLPGREVLNYVVDLCIQLEK